MKKRAKNGSVPRYFDKDYKSSYQKMRAELDALKAEVAALKGVVDKKDPPSKEGPEEERCPFCKVSFKGPPIPPPHREHYGDATHFSRKIGIYDRALDKTVSWRCPDCGKEWPRTEAPRPGCFRTGSVDKR